MDFVYFIKTENRLTSSSLCHHSLNVPALQETKTLQVSEFPRHYIILVDII